MLHPVGEGPANDGVNHVNHPLPRQLRNVLLIREVRICLLMFTSLLEDAFKREALILWTE